MSLVAAEARRFQLVLIKPSHYDDDGYLIQWARTYTPSNSLAALYGIASDCADRRILGPDVDLRTTVKDEVVTRISARKIIRQIHRSGGKGLVALVGVQSNQFPRAVDIGRRLRAGGLPVCIGGFHAAGSLALPFDRDRYSRRYLPVCDALTFMISSGVPVATT